MLLPQSPCLIVPSSNRGNNKMKFQANIAYKTVVERKKYTVTADLDLHNTTLTAPLWRRHCYWFHYPFLRTSKCDTVGEWQMSYSGGMANVMQWGNGKCDAVGEWHM